MGAVSEDLGQYVKRVMKQRGLSVRDVQSIAGAKITASYVSSIVVGTAKNLTVEKLKALAVGLGVEEDEVFLVARRRAAPAAARRQSGSQRERERDQRARASGDLPYTLVMLDLRRKIVLSPDITEITQELLRLSPAKRGIVMQYIKRLNRDQRKG